MNVITGVSPAELVDNKGPVEAPTSSRASIQLEGRESFCADRINPIRHNLHQHPLLQLPRLAKLARDLMPTKQCRFIRPGTTQTSEFVHTPKTPDGQSIDDVFAHIEEPGAWVALYEVQTDPEYQALLADAIESVRPGFEATQPGLFKITGYIFISAPPSVTPFHIDRENNFWLQIRGRKLMTVFDRNDRDVVPAVAVENFIVNRSLQGVRLDPELRGRGFDFDVGAGEGVYFPSTTPHMTETHTDWVRPGDGISISLGVNFYTSVTRRHARVYQCNRVLRRLGMDPRLPGQSVWRDRIKAGLGQVITETRTRFRGYAAPMGMT